MKLPALALVISAPAWGDAPTIVVHPVVPQVAVADDGFRITDLSIGYRREQLDDGGLDGAALRVVWAGRGPLELEWMPSAAWGAGDAHVELSVGLRYVLGKPGHVRPFVVIAPVVSLLEDGMTTWHTGIGANAGIGVDIDLPHPGALSLDVRAGQNVDVDSEQLSGWQVLATASIGLHGP
ncbi:MAG TPA: hypothetical protein VLX92_26930 [Kofleriaceae bacterium]|nr:hypothetical protein [Kofleriaceae bacterium]